MKLVCQGDTKSGESEYQMPFHLKLIYILSFQGLYSFRTFFFDLSTRNDQNYERCYVFLLLSMRIGVNERKSFCYFCYTNHSHPSYLLLHLVRLRTVGETGDTTPYILTVNGDASH